jgi:hypothetical protein
MHMAWLACMVRILQRWPLQTRTDVDILAASPFLGVVSFCYTCNVYISMVLTVIGTLIVLAGDRKLLEAGLHRAGNTMAPGFCHNLIRSRQLTVHCQSIDSTCYMLLL